VAPNKTDRGVAVVVTAVVVVVVVVVVLVVVGGGGGGMGSEGVGHWVSSEAFFLLSAFDPAPVLCSTTTAALEEAVEVVVAVVE
jgi:preprotein translocase subunit SecG